MQIFWWRLLRRSCDCHRSATLEQGFGQLVSSCCAAVERERLPATSWSRINPCVHRLSWLCVTRDFRHPLYPHCPFHHASFCTLSYSARNKDYKLQGVSSFFRNYSEKDKGSVMTGPTGTSQAAGEGSSAAVNLPVTRWQRKAAITRHLGSLSRHIAEGKTKLIHERLDKIQASFTEFEQINNAYLTTLTEESDLDESEAWFAEIEGRYIAGVTSANDWLHENEQQTSKNHGNVSSDQGAVAGVNKDILNMLTIPKLEIDTFLDNPLECQSFMAIFDECVGNKVSDDQIKLTRLLQYTSGPAKAAIRNCSLTDGSLGYSNAREIMKSRFGNDHIISRKIIDDLTSGKSLSMPSDIRQLADDLALAAAALGSLKITSEVDNQSTILNILKRCPKPVQSKWRTKALEIKRDTDNYPNFSKFVEFVTKTATDWCDPVYGGDALKASNLHTKMSSVNTVTAEPNASVSPNVQPNTPVSHNDNGRLKQRCSACNTSHRLIYCGVFRTMSPRDRFQFCKHKRLCYNCLMPNHVATKCKSLYCSRLRKTACKVSTLWYNEFCDKPVR